MAENLNTDLAIVYKSPDTGELVATPYFEDYLFKIIQEFGGEGEQLPSDINEYFPEYVSLLSNFKTLKNRIDELEKQLDNSIIMSSIKEIRHRLEALEMGDTPLNLTNIYQKINDLEKQI